MEKKRHHYIPITYLKGFVAPDGMLFAYRKDEPNKMIRAKPEEIGFEKYYYSQPLPNEGQDNNRIEDFFSTIEGRWPELVQRLRSGDSGKDLLSALFEFMGMMRVRVPAAREMVEANLADTVKATGRLLDEIGELPPKPDGIEDIWDHLTVSVDPHRSIHAMAPMAEGFGQVLDRCGFRVIHNLTNISFLTSDNPIIYFDPTVGEDHVQPYRLHRSMSDIELLFPLDMKTILVGHSRSRYRFLNAGLESYELKDTHQAKRLNRFIVRFGYRFVFAPDRSHERLIEKYSDHSPVGKTEIVPGANGSLIVLQTVFGPRPSLTKWVRPKKL